MKRVGIRFALMLCFVCLFCFLPTRANALTEDGKVVVVLDPGHGGYDSGAVNGETTEREQSLIVAKEVRRLLEENGNFQVYMTREERGPYRTLYERAKLCDEVNADFCMSLHFNAYSDPDFRGAKVLVSVIPEYSMKTLGRNVTAKLHDYIGVPDRGLLMQQDYGDIVYYWNEEDNWDYPLNPSKGYLSDYYGIPGWCAKFAVPAVIVEHCYISNATEVQLIRDPEKLMLMAKADAEAIIEYYDHTHVLGDYEVDYPTTCMFAGKESRRCEICDCRGQIRNLDDQPNPDKHHLYEIDYQKPTCEEEGYVEYACAVTFRLIRGKLDVPLHTVRETLDAKGHAYPEGGGACSRCGKEGGYVTPPETDPPETDPPTTEPPVTNPPDTDPPVTVPPVSGAPDTDPPGTTPATTVPDSDPPPMTETGESSGAPPASGTEPSESGSAGSDRPRDDQPWLLMILAGGLLAAAALLAVLLARRGPKGRRLTFEVLEEQAPAEKAPAASAQETEETVQK